MTRHDFSLRFRLPDAAADADQYIDALAEAGCLDALVGIGRRGQISLDFSREAASASEAIESATRDVTSAIPNAELVQTWLHEERSLR